MKRTFGIELEVSTRHTRNFVEKALTEAGIENWSVKYDGSINGWEIVSPPLEYTEKNLEEVKLVVQVIRTKVKGRATKACGMHIHHDIKDFDLNQLERLYRLYRRYQTNAMKTFICPTRFDNQYCRTVSNYQISELANSNNINEFQANSGSRYRALNIKSFVKYGTIEFRQHQASTDWLQTLAWLEITKAMVETAVDTSKDLPTEDTPSNNGEALNQMLKELGLESNQTVLKSTAKSYKYQLKTGFAS